VDHGEWKEKKKNAPQKHSSQEAWKDKDPSN
jgi:hypothetical protein